AQGTATDPIVFTSIDALTTDLDKTDTGLWGGIIVLGKGRINGNVSGSWAGDYPTNSAEGVSPATGDDSLIIYGGTDDTDDSGVISYVSIRHGGVILGAGKEINGLTLCAVGSATQVDHVEVYANKDDGIEIFGGNVNLDHIVLAYCYDDSLDLDEGYRGSVQYLLAIQDFVSSDVTDKGGEWDGADLPVKGTPEMMIHLANATFIGLGDKAANTALNIRVNGAAKVYNSIFTEYDKMLKIDADSTDRFNAGDIVFAGNIWHSSTEANTTPALLQTGAEACKSDGFFTSNNNQIANPGLTVTRDANGTITTAGAIDVTPAVGSIAATSPGATVSADPVQTNFIGAFSPYYNWALGWTKLYDDGTFAVEGTWFNHPKWGWLWLSSGSLAEGGYVYFQNTDQWVWIALEDASGYWTYTFK
ncbi:MAG TPA: hypothetical protein PKI32_09580, partial [Opitutales bacterium]|nr:hypothetical protein [Opitutales bacterium]